MSDSNALPTNKDLLTELIKKLPKTDIHLHFDGSIRLDTLIELSKQSQLTLPSYTVEGMEELVFKDKYPNLEAYLKTFQYSCAILHKPENIERVAYELAEDNWNEGVRYIEVRFAPHLTVNNEQDVRSIIKSMSDGMARAAKNFNLDSSKAKDGGPPFRFSIIACAMRFFGNWSHYYNAVHTAFPHSQPKRMIQAASDSLADSIIELSQNDGLPIVAMDIAGSESGYPAIWHKTAFDKIRRNNLHATVHAGEAYGPESVYQAVHELQAERIGHGFKLYEQDEIKGPNIKDKSAFVEVLKNYIATRQLTFEVCLTSNHQTTPTIREIKDHNLKHMLNDGMSLTLCTDNRTVSKTSVTNEILIACQSFDLTSDQLEKIIMEGFRKSFFPGTSTEKATYVKQCSDYYQQILNKTLT